MATLQTATGNHDNNYTSIDSVRQHLSAIVSCWASKLILLKLFHIASVSGDISKVSRNATALQQNKTNIDISLSQLNCV